MTQSSGIDYVTARKSDHTVRKSLASIGQKTLAEALGRSEPWVSRWKDSEIQPMCELLAALGLKVVPVSFKCLPDEHIRSLEYFARVGMRTDSLGLDWDNE